MDIGRLPEVAYFSMEVALDQAIPTYSGGLGVLSGDTLRGAADLATPMVAISLVHRKGYLRQHLDATGRQSEEPEDWRPEDHAELVGATASVTIEGRRVEIRAWRFDIQGTGGGHVPVYLLDTSDPRNTEWDRSLTDHLYGGDERYRFCQEVVLGIGGIRLLRRLGFGQVRTFHMNEGHAALLALALLEEEVGESELRRASADDIERVRRRCVFTTHTPVPAGHDAFSRDLMRQVLGADRASALEASRCCPEESLNMTFLALRFSRYINGVAMRHGEVSGDMFPRYAIKAITNGVHGTTWAAPPLQRMFDSYIPSWRRDNVYLRYAVKIPLEEIAAAHLEAKRHLMDVVKAELGLDLDPGVLTIGFARRAAVYKRADLVLTDVDHLRELCRTIGPIQLIFSGKAHPRDEPGKAMIRRVFVAGVSRSAHPLSICYLENYDMRLAQALTSGVDLWLNTPQRPFEASGTSGMKAAINGVPSLSVLDGWWVEGCVEGVTGWSIGGRDENLDEPDATLLYRKLEDVVLPMFYDQREKYLEVMRSTIAINGSFFNTHRMVAQYASNAYSTDE